MRPNIEPEARQAIQRTIALFAEATWHADPLRPPALDPSPVMRSHTDRPAEGADTRWARDLVRRYSRRLTKMNRELHDEMYPPPDKPKRPPRPRCWCRNCGHTRGYANQHGARYCDRCGHELKDPDE